MNILVIRTHRLGDILQLTPMLGGLKRRYPESTVYVLTGNDYVDLLEGNMCVDAIIPFPEKEYRYALKKEPDKYPSLFNACHDLIGELKRIGFDLIINRQYEWGARFASLVGAPHIVGGAYSPGRGFYLDDRPSRELVDAIKGDRRKNRRNLVDWACRIAGLPPDDDRRMCLPVGSTARREAQRLIDSARSDGERPLVAVQAGAARSFRQWGADNFAEVIRRLIHENGRSVVLMGSEDERDIFTGPGNGMGGEERNLINLMGKTSLKTTGAVLERCEVLITGDTGPMHMAAAVGTPVLSLFFGTAYPWETGPYGYGHFILYADLPCAPCLDPARCERDHLCKAVMTPSVVMDAFAAFDAFRSGGAVGPGCVSPPVRLLATSRDAGGEQVLVPAEQLAGGVPERGLRIDDGPDEAYLPAMLRARGDGIIRSFMEGESEKGFMDFPAYLEEWLVLRTGAPSHGDEGLESTGELMNTCLEALRSRDTVALIDAIEYGFNPWLEQSFSANHF
jgi:heptosyltransferase-2